MNGLGVYVHIPFCTVKCGYCDFNAYAGLHYLADTYAETLLADLASWHDVLERKQVETIFFGGGTPSEIHPAVIAAVVNAVKAHASVDADAEISLEANPGTVTATSLRQLREAGVNRLSLGVQSFADDQLRFLDRVHSGEAAAASFRLARDAGFDEISVDLLFGLPGQDVEQWMATLEQAVGLRPEHVSTYALTVEPGTPLAVRVERGEVVLPGEDELAELYEVGCSFLEAAGIHQYEVSNFATKGRESRHNRIYWEAREYVGIGAGAHGFVDGVRYENVAHPAEYIRRAEAVAERPFVANAYVPEGASAMADWLSLRLRLLEGFAAGEFEARFGVELNQAVGAALERCREAGLLEIGSRVKLTGRGLLLHGEVVVQLFMEAERWWACRSVDLLAEPPPGA